jgi:hypothetical protein
MKLTDVYKLLKGPIQIEKVGCLSTGFKVEGPFHTPALFQLNEDQLELVEKLAIYGGNLKDLAADLGISYPTLRNRLREVSDFLATHSEAKKQERLKILKDIDEGRINPDAGAELLEKL